MFRVPAIGLLSMLLAGCATSPKGLERPELRSAFELDQNYQLTLKRITQADEECRPKPLVPLGSLINDVQQYPDLREARIVKGASGVGTQIYQVIVVREPAPERTEVALYTKIRRDDHLARLRRWAEGGTDCEL